MPAQSPHELYDSFGQLGARTLADEFPHDASTLTRLRFSDNHFCHLSERYHALNRSIQRIEAEAESASDAYLARLKKQRLALLDNIALIIENDERKWAQTAQHPSGSSNQARGL